MVDFMSSGTTRFSQMIESLHYRERGRTRLLESPVTGRSEKVLFLVSKKRVQFSQKAKAEHRIDGCGNGVGLLQVFGATVPDE
jgi:hypothetical protein